MAGSRGEIEGWLDAVLEAGFVPVDSTGDLADIDGLPDDPALKRKIRDLATRVLKTSEGGTNNGPARFIIRGEAPELDRALEAHNEKTVSIRSTQEIVDSIPRGFR